MTSTARKAETTDNLIAFEHESQSLHVLAPSAWPVEALEAYEEGKVTTFLRGILSSESWATFKTRKPKVADLQGLVVSIQAAAGISGN
jgi:hypothetical protein